MMRKFLIPAIAAAIFILGVVSNAAEPPATSDSPTSAGASKPQSVAILRPTSAAETRPTTTAEPAVVPVAEGRPTPPGTANPARSAEAAPAPHPAGPSVNSGRLVTGFSISQVPATGSPIVLEAGKGTLIRLPRPAATVFIANPEVADVQVKSPSLIYVSAKAPGDTVVYAVDTDDNVLLHAPVRVDHDLSRLRQSIHALMPGEHIDVNSVQGSLVLSGNVSSAGRAERARALASALTADVKGGQVVNQMSVAIPNQVSLRVKIAEVDRSVLKALGVNWNAAVSADSFRHTTFGLLTNNPVTSQQITNQNTFRFGLITPSAQINTTLDALGQEGLITTLAQPNLTTTNGQTASFLAGGEFPVPIASNTGTGGGTTVTVEFKKYGVQLAFTPTIIDANHLSLRIRPEVSQLTSVGAVQTAGFTIPALTVRSADTTVELGSGQSFALGGLLQNNTQQDVSKIPWLGDIPILGQLFRSDRFQRNESELIIIVTPYLVQPSTVALAAPTDGFDAPHDSQRLLNGENYRQGLPGSPRGPLPPGGQGLIGPVGFRLD
jgi:pilus assembly protein CpaC